MQTERSIENFSYVGQILDIAHQAFIVITENCSRAYDIALESGEETHGHSIDVSLKTTA